MTGAYIFSGRELSPEDVDVIRWAAAEYPGLSRTELAATVCELLDWVTPNGRSKVPQCLACFEKLETDGIVALPRAMVKKPPSKSLTPTPINLGEDIYDCENIELTIVEPGPAMRRWRGYLDAYHPLGAKAQFGSRIQYFVQSNGRDLGCLQFSAAAWALAPRDEWIGWTQADRKKRLHLVVNNSRCLILPNVHIKNLASRMLSLAARKLKGDWADLFGYAPVLLETFVDSSLYEGIIYKASNWTCLGMTKGRGRMDRQHDTALVPKLIFVYPLQRNFNKILLGEHLGVG